jgi:hypothetical protein
MYIDKSVNLQKGFDNKNNQLFKPSFFYENKNVFSSPDRSGILFLGGKG